MVVAIAIAALLTITQRKQISTARMELARSEATSTSGQTTDQTPPISTTVSEEIKRLRAENRDIYKLRGEISRAREKRKEVERMQSENASLREQIDKIKSNPEAAAGRTFPLADKGQATPEAALETAFWAMHEGNIDALSRAMPMAIMGFDKMPAEEKTNSITILRIMASTIRKLEILDRKSDSPDETQLSVNFVAPDNINLGGALNGTKTFVLRRVNDMWQIVSDDL